jgi:hypothetical protein
VLQNKHNGETMSAAYPVVARSAVLVGLQWIGLVLGGSLAVMFVWLLAYLAIEGRQNVNDAIGQEKSNAIEQENSALCSRFGITRGTQLYVACAEAVDHICEHERQRQAYDGFI